MLSFYAISQIHAKTDRNKNEESAEETAASHMSNLKNNKSWRS